MAVWTTLKEVYCLRQDNMTDFFTGLIRSLYGITESIGLPNYGLAIIMLTLVVKLAMFPLTRMQSKSMKAMQEIQPMVKELQKKYANDKEKMNMEVAKLYQEQKVNPMASCLPLLIQFPIIIALFNAMRDFFVPELNASFLWVNNLGEPDLWVLPILAGISTFLQQKVAMTGEVTGQQKSMLYIMPVFMGWISRSFPAGLALYWFFFNVWSTLEQLVIRGKFKFGGGEGTAKP